MPAGMFRSAQPLWNGRNKNPLFHPVISGAFKIHGFTLIQWCTQATNQRLDSLEMTGLQRFVHFRTFNPGSDFIKHVRKHENLLNTENSCSAKIGLPAKVLYIYHSCDWFPMPLLSSNGICSQLYETGSWPFHWLIKWYFVFKVDFFYRILSNRRNHFFSFFFVRYVKWIAMPFQAKVICI